MPRIALSADNRNGLDSVISPHFGRCPYYVLVDIEGREVMDTQDIENPYYEAHAPGQVPRFIQAQNIDVMITGGMGGRAIMLFEQFGIEPVTGARGTVRASLEAYLGGNLQGAESCLESQEHGHEAEIPAEGEYEKDEVGRTREEAESLQRQLADIQARLDKLAGKG